MPIIFEEHTSRMGGKHLMSDEPFAVIRESGEIYLSGDYTIEELRAILEAAEQRCHPFPARAQPSSPAIQPAWTPSPGAGWLGSVHRISQTNHGWGC